MVELGDQTPAVWRQFHARIRVDGPLHESAIKGLLAKPEDRTAVVKNMVEQAGGKLLAWYMLFGEYDWITVYEMPSGKEAAATMLAVAGAGVVTDMRTMLAMTGAEAKAAFEAGKKLGAAYRAPGAGSSSSAPTTKPAGRRRSAAGSARVA